jgi:predicted RNA-binding Zn-ribbon protein involved in translation (DUF1610 family)
MRKRKVVPLSKFSLFRCLNCGETFLSIKPRCCMKCGAALAFLESLSNPDASK